MLSYTLFQSSKWHRIINFYVVIFLRKRNVGLGFFKLKLVFLYYKVQIAVLLRSVPKNDSIPILNSWLLKIACFASIAIIQHSSPWRSEGARSMCFRECAALCRLIVYLSHFLCSVSQGSRNGGGPHNQKVREWALPLINYLLFQS